MLLNSIWKLVLNEFPTHFARIYCHPQTAISQALQHISLLFTPTDALKPNLINGSRKCHMRRPTLRLEHADDHVGSALVYFVKIIIGEQLECNNLTYFLGDVPGKPNEGA